MRYPSDAYRLLGSLESAAGSLPQALAQIDSLLQRWLEDDQISIDGGDFAGDPAAAVAAALTHLLKEARPGRCPGRRPVTLGRRAD